MVDQEGTKDLVDLGPEGICVLISTTEIADTAKDANLNINAHFATSLGMVSLIAGRPRVIMEVMGTVELELGELLVGIETRTGGKNMKRNNRKRFPMCRLPL